MPRRNRPPRPTPAGSPAAPNSPLSGALGWARTESAADGDWLVRTVPGAQGRKTYRCPGCDHEIPPGVGHVVAWPASESEYGDTEVAGYAVPRGAGYAGLVGRGTGGSAGGRGSTGSGGWAGDGGSAGYGAAEERRHWHTNCWQTRHRRRPGRRAPR
ncbi:MAG TPA: hypothetical protein VH141_17815 [Pseudonocardia sp.]|nr:hypothetical protein [Pseudonocardia sp.]